MFIPLFRDWKIRTKLISVTLFVVLVPLLCVAFLSMDRFGKALKNASDEDLEHLVRSVYSMCKVHQEEVQEKGQIVHFLDEEIKGIKVGDTGYVYIIDTAGDLKIHPTKEGENLLDLKDSSGFQYIRAMITDALALGNGEVGTIRESSGLWPR